MSTLTPAVAKRLALIRLLLDGAEEASGLEAPFDADSVNRLHDVAEMFLALAVQQHNGTIPGQFIGYWTELKNLTGQAPGYRAAMERVNKTRVSLKHYGIQPHKEEVEHAATAVRNLLADETPRLFGVNLDDVSLAAFVTSDVGARAIQMAEEHWAEGKAEEAFADLAEAFAAVISDYQEDKVGLDDQSVFDSMGTFRLHSRTTRRRQGLNSAQAQWEEGIEDLLEALDRKLMLVGFGIDLRRYARFDALTPVVRWPAQSVTRVYTIPAGWRRTDEEYVFCRDFVISAAIRLAEFDFSYEYDGIRSLDDMGGITQFTSRSAFAPPFEDSSQDGSA